MRIIDIEGGCFQIVNSFAIRARGEFYLIGNLVKGAAQVQWFVNVQIHFSLMISLPIRQLEMVEVVGKQSPYVMLIVTADFKQTDQLLSVEMNDKTINITVTSES